MTNEQIDLIKTIVQFAAESRAEYGHTKEHTVTETRGCSTQRVPVALLNRIRELGESL